MRYKLLSFIATALLSVLIVVSQAHAQTKDDAAIQSVIEDQINAFQSKDYDRAFSHASPSIKKLFKTSDRFIGMVKNGYKPLYDPSAYTFSRTLEKDGSLYQEVIVTDQNGKQWQAVYTLQQQADGSWKITGVKMEPTMGAAT